MTTQGLLHLQQFPRSTCGSSIGLQVSITIHMESVLINTPGSNQITLICKLPQQPQASILNTSPCIFVTIFSQAYNIHYSNLLCPSWIWRIYIIPSSPFLYITLNNCSVPINIICESLSHQVLKIHPLQYFTREKFCQLIQQVLQGHGLIIHFFIVSMEFY